MGQAGKGLITEGVGCLAKELTSEALVQKRGKAKTVH